MTDAAAKQLQRETLPDSLPPKRDSPALVQASRARPLGGCSRAAVSNRALEPLAVKQAAFDSASLMYGRCMVCAGEDFACYLIDFLFASPQQGDLVWCQHPRRGRGTDEPVEQRRCRGDTSALASTFSGLFHICRSVGWGVSGQDGTGGSTRTVITSVSWYCWWRTDEA